MKLTYRDKIILAVFLAIAILLVGFLWLIKPKTKKLNDNKLRLEELQDQKEEVDMKIAQIEPLQEKIKTIYSDTKKITEIFVPVTEVNSPIKLDRALQKYAEENNVKVLSMELSNTAVQELGYYYAKTDDFDASLREAADINGDLQAKYEEDNADQLSLSERTVEGLYQTRYGVRVNGTKEDIWNYLKAIEDYDKALLINSVTIQDYSFGQDAIEEAGEAIAQVVSPQEEAQPAEGEEPAEEQTEENAEEPQQSAVTVRVGDKEITNTSDVSFVITAYSIYEMPEPDVTTIPDASSEEE